MEPKNCATFEAEPFLDDKIFSDLDEDNYEPIITHANRRKSSRKSLLLSLPSSSSVQTNIHQSPLINRSRMSEIRDAKHRRSSFGFSKDSHNIINPTSTPKNSPHFCCKVDVEEVESNVVTKLTYCNDDVGDCQTVSNELKTGDCQANPTESDTVGKKEKIETNSTQSKNDDFCPEKLVESYQNECIEWDNLVGKYRSNLMSHEFKNTFPDKNWIENNYGLSKYAEFIWTPDKGAKGYLGKYNCLDDIIQSVSTSGALILYELQRLPFLFNKQSLFVSGLNHKMKVKQVVEERTHFSKQTLHDLLSEFVSNEEVTTSPTKMDE